ncbi:hypothetical protein PFICI_00423 [Pestalotiopsis fici W106-1]|uniref:G-patch domain-containing protein n=1 Tax=Pestalotiopsis fici (strain W106-1 / CGMCC3.15140) TaxID=1229662 RepID=W3XKS0_PESFW|nr:uncharacterized protein PFICI_00423 [Pestalotiopsis fici W106-1]ETS86595.1 hypothetical protein PFICI_00423 [Pestalotiopsis fici W106-1]
MGDSGDEDDYMSMSFLTESDPSTTRPETSLQRRQRERREAEIRGRPKSKQELAAEAKAAREAALSRSLIPGVASSSKSQTNHQGEKDHDDDEDDPWSALAPPEPALAKKSKGLSMMEKMGFAPGSALGAKENNSHAATEPIRLHLKEDRGGIGLDAQRKRALDEAAEREGVNPAAAAAAAKKPKIDPLEFRERNRREREVKRWEGQVYGAQKVCERMDEERDAETRAQQETEEEEEDDGAVDENGKRRKKKRTLSTRPLKSINVLWRGLVRRREEAERERRMRYDLEQSLSRLPTYEDDTEDADDAQALGKKKMAYVPVEDLEEEDPGLDEFNALEPDEKLRRLVDYLRKEYRYCFWCKCSYPDEEMDGCPGLTEDDHD